MAARWPPEAGSLPTTSVVEQTDLPAPQERVWRWFTEEMVPDYQDWHSAQVMARALTGLPLTPDSEIFFDDWIGAPW